MYWVPAVCQAAGCMLLYASSFNTQKNSVSLETPGLTEHIVTAYRSSELCTEWNENRHYALWTRANYQTSPSLSFSIYKIGTILPCKALWRTTGPAQNISHFYNIWHKAAARDNVVTVFLFRFVSVFFALRFFTSWKRKDRRARKKRVR